jgi:hypothetical protein
LPVFQPKDSGETVSHSEEVFGGKYKLSGGVGTGEFSFLQEVSTTRHKHNFRKEDIKQFLFLDVNVTNKFNATIANSRILNRKNAKIITKDAKNSNSCK